MTNEISNLKSQIRELTFLHETSQVLTATLDPDDVLRSLMTQVRDYFRVEAASVALLEEETGDAVFRIAVGKAAEDVIRALIIVWQQKKPADYDDMQESWDEFTASPGQPMVVAKLSVVPKLCVLGDEYLFKIIDEVQSSGVLNNA